MNVNQISIQLLSIETANRRWTQHLTCKSFRYGYRHSSLHAIVMAYTSVSGSSFGNIYVEITIENLRFLTP